MKALMKWESGAGHVALRETERPVPGPDEVLIRVAAAGICGTDLAIWSGESSFVKDGRIRKELSLIGDAVPPEEDASNSRGAD